MEVFPCSQGEVNNMKNKKSSNNPFAWALMFTAVYMILNILASVGWPYLSKMLGL